MIIQNTIPTSLAVQPGISFGEVAPGSVANTTTPTTPQQQPSPQQLKMAVDGINQAMQQSNQSLEFSVDTGTKMPVVRVVDTTTGQLIVQIPSKVALAIAQSIDQQQHGLLLNQQA